MSQTGNATQYQTPPATGTVTFNDYVYRSLTHQVQEDFAIVGTLGGLYGVLIILSVLSIHALVRRSKRIPPTALVLSSANLILFASTTIYMVTTIRFYLSQFLGNLKGADLYTDGAGVVNAVPEYLGNRDSPLHACASTATLTINVILGDAIVCWRACVVWQRNHVVMALCGLFLLATSILGAVNTADGCGPNAFYRTFNMKTGLPQGTMFEGLPIGIAACVLSLSTNILATALVGQKAWESRRRLKKYFAAGPRGSQMGKLFSLLIESGAVYCAIWAVVVAFQIRTYKLDTWVALYLTGTAYSFLDAFGVFLNGALVPLIAIYPTLVIVIVALDRSHIERGITQHMESFPTPHITAATATSGTIAADLRSEAVIMAIDDRCASSECGDRCEDDCDSTRSSGLGEGEPKGERIV